MTKNWIGMGVLAVALVVSGSTCFACGEEKAADAKDVKTVVANGETKGCDMPCCAHAAEAAVAANVKNAAAPAVEKPCAATAAKGCPKKAAATATVAKAEPAQDTAKAEPAVDPGAQR